MARSTRADSLKFIESQGRVMVPAAARWGMGGGGGKVEAGKVEAGGPGGCEDANAKHSDPDRRMSYVKKKKNW